ncbi:unnamed protein product [Ixodes hexagonus]
MATIEEVSGEILHLIYDVIRSIEKDSHDPNQKRDSYDSAVKIQELRGKLQLCRDLIHKLPGVDYTREEQLRKVEALRRQLQRKRELLVKYKSMCHFDMPDIKGAHVLQTPRKIYDHYFGYFRKTDLYGRTVARSDPKLRGFVLSNETRLDVSALSDSELVEAVLCCEDASFWKRHCCRIESECCRRVGYLPAPTSVAVMDAWAASLGGKVYLREVLPHWTRHVRAFETFDFVHLVYLASLHKSAPESFLQAVTSRLETVLKDCNLREVGILCSSLFKLKARVADDAVLAAVAQFAAEGLSSRGDRFDVVSTLKFLRLCEHYDGRLLAELAAYVQEKSGEFVTVECAHFLAAYASVAAYDEPTFRKLEQRVVDLLQNPGETAQLSNEERYKSHPAELPRVKDVAKVLWALAHVGHSADGLTLKTAEKFLEQRFTPNDIFHVLDALQSFVCLDFYPRHLIEETLSRNVQRTITSSHKHKPSKQLYFVKMSASVMLGDDFKCPPEDLQSSRTDQAQYERAGFQDLADLFAARRLAPSCILPHIHIAGVTFEVCPSSLNVKPVISLRDLQRGRKQLDLSQSLIDALSGKRKTQVESSDVAHTSTQSVFVSVELLDKDVLVRGSESTMRGILRAKVIQLRRLGVKVVFATPNQVRLVSELRGVTGDEWWNQFLKRCASDSDPQFCQCISGDGAALAA